MNGDDKTNKIDEIKLLFDDLYKASIDSLKIVTTMADFSVISIHTTKYVMSEDFNRLLIKLKHAVYNIVSILTYQDVNWNELLNFTTKEERDDYLMTKMVEEVKLEALFVTTGKHGTCRQRILDQLKEHEEQKRECKGIVSEPSSKSTESNSIDKLIEQARHKISIQLSLLSSKLKQISQSLLKQIELHNFNLISQFNEATNLYKQTVLLFMQFD